MSATIQKEDIPELVRDALVEEFHDSQDRCVRGYFYSQSIQKVMEYLDGEQVQELRGSRVVKDSTESFSVPSYDLPKYIHVEEQLKRELSIDYDRSKTGGFDWGAVRDFLVDSKLKDIAIHKLVIRMENPELRDHLFRILRNAINYPGSYSGEFTDPFYFVMESRAPELPKDYDHVQEAHDQGYLKELGWNPRTLDLMSIWSHHAWAKSGNKPMGVTQHEVEELAFNQRESDRPVFGAVNSPLVVNRWRTPFGNGMTDLRHYDWEEDQQGWVRTQ